MGRPKLLVEYTSEMGLVEGQQAYTVALQSEATLDRIQRARAAGITRAEKQSQQQIQTANSRVASTIFLASAQIEYQRAQQWAAGQAQEMQGVLQSLQPDPLDMKRKRNEQTRVGLERWRTAQNPQQPTEGAPGMVPGEKTAGWPAQMQSERVGNTSFAGGLISFTDNQFRQLLSGGRQVVEARTFLAEPTTQRTMVSYMYLAQLRQAGAISPEGYTSAMSDPQVYKNWNEHMGAVDGEVARAKLGINTVPSKQMIDEAQMQASPRWNTYIDTLTVPNQ